MSAVLELRHRLRPMRPADVDAVHDIERRVYDFPWSAGHFRDSLLAGHGCWVYQMGARVVGYAVMMRGVDEAHLLNLVIDPAFQRQGLGRGFVGQLCELARGHGAQALFLEVRPSNLAAQRLYRSMGFAEVGRRRGYYPARDGREDALVMRLDLAEQGGGGDV
jgi:ribosomal-protein-alanine N-acetyltransferase